MAHRNESDFLPPHLRLTAPGPDALRPDPSSRTAEHRRLSPLTREQWLTQAVDELRPLFVSEPLPAAIKITCSWPSTSSSRSSTVGEAWTASDGWFHIYISPRLVDVTAADASGVLSVVAHELVHVSNYANHPDEKPGHGPMFARVAHEIGFVGKKMKSTTAGDDLVRVFVDIARKLGAYPHATPSPIRPKQRGRNVKVACRGKRRGVGCGFKFRATRTWERVWSGMKCPSCGGTMGEA